MAIDIHKNKWVLISFYTYTLKQKQKHFFFNNRKPRSKKKTVFMYIKILAYNTVCMMPRRGISIFRPSSALCWSSPCVGDRLGGGASSWEAARCCCSALQWSHLLLHPKTSTKMDVPHIVIPNPVNVARRTDRTACMWNWNKYISTWNYFIIQR